MHAKADVRVVCRFRPLHEGEAEAITREAPGVSPQCVVYDDAHVEVLDRYEGVTIGDACTTLGRDDRMKVVANRTLKDLGKDFILDAILATDQTQEDVYALVGAPVVHNVIEGYNGTVLAYGQTGSGKTHSMIGPDGGTLGFFGNQADDDAPAASGTALMSPSTTSGTLSSSQPSRPSVGSHHGGAPYAMRGLVPRVVEGIFNRLAEFDPAERTWSLHLSIYEIYREEIIDLLGGLPTQRLRGLRARQRETSASTAPAARTVRPRSGAPPGASATGATGAPHPAKQEYRIREDVVGGRGVYVESLESIEVLNAKEVLQLVHEAMLRRRTSATNANETSSRSHSLVVLTLEQLDKSASAEGVRIASRLNLVDLAGSEKLSKTHADGDRLKEAQTINLSLTLLGNVIHRLTDGRSGYIPYRDSKLTRLLQDSLGGNSITTLLCHCSTSMLDREETLSTLRFAQRAKRVRNKPRLNRDLTAKEMGLQLVEAQQRVEMLEKELQLHNEVRTNLRDKHAKDKREAERRQQALVDSLRREIEQLREELRLKEGELVHEKDRAAFQRSEKDQLAETLAALRTAHTNECAALEQALLESHQQNQKLVSELNDLRREMQEVRANRSTSPGRHLSPRAPPALERSARAGHTRDVGVNTAPLTATQAQRLAALLDGETDATTEPLDAALEGRLLASDEVQRAVHAAGTLIASMANTATKPHAAAFQSELQAAVEVLEQVIAAVSTTLALDTEDTGSADAATRRDQLRETLQLASRLLGLWQAYNGQLGADQLQGVLSGAGIEGKEGDRQGSDDSSVEAGHVLPRAAMTPLVRSMESLLAGQLRFWANEQSTSVTCTDGETTQTTAAAGPLVAWHAAMLQAYAEAEPYLVSSLAQFVADEALPKARSAMQSAVEAQCTAHGVALASDVATWLHANWTEVVFDPEGLVHMHCTDSAAAVCAAFRGVFEEHLAAFVRTEDDLFRAHATELAHEVEASLSAALEQRQLDGAEVTPEFVAELFSVLVSTRCHGELDDRSASRHRRVEDFQSTLLGALRDVSKTTFRRQDAVLRQKLAAHGVALVTKSESVPGVSEQADVIASLTPSLVAAAQQEAGRVGPQQHKHLLHAVRRKEAISREACATFEAAARVQDEAVLDALLTDFPLVCGKLQVMMLLAEPAPSASAEDPTDSPDVASLSGAQLDKLALRLHLTTRVELDQAAAASSPTEPLGVTTSLTREAWQQLATFLSAYTPGSMCLSAAPRVVSADGGVTPSYVERHIDVLVMPDLVRCYRAAQCRSQQTPSPTVEGALIIEVRSCVRELVFASRDGSACVSARRRPGSATTDRATVAVTSLNAGCLLQALSKALQEHVTATADRVPTSVQTHRERVAELLAALAEVVCGASNSPADRRVSANEGNDAAETAAPLTDDDLQLLRSLSERLVRFVDGANQATLVGMAQWLTRCLHSADVQERDAAIRAALVALGLSLSETTLKDGEAHLTNVRVAASLDVLFLGRQLALIESTLGGPGTMALLPRQLSGSQDGRRASSGGSSFQSDAQLLKAPPRLSTVASVHEALVLSEHLPSNVLSTASDGGSPTRREADAHIRALEEALRAAEQQLAQRSGGGSSTARTVSPSLSLEAPLPLMLTAPPVAQRRAVDAGTLTERYWESDAHLQQERDDHLRHELTALLQLLEVDVAEVCGLQPDEIDLVEATQRVREEISYIKKVEEPAQRRALEEGQRALACIYDAVKHTSAELEALRAQIRTRPLLAKIAQAATGEAPLSSPGATDTTGSSPSRLAQALQRQVNTATALFTAPEDATAAPHTPNGASANGNHLAAQYENPLLRPRNDVNRLGATPDGKPSHVRNPQALVPTSSRGEVGQEEAPPVVSSSRGTALARSRRLSSVVQPSTTASLIALATVSSPSPNKHVNPHAGESGEEVNKETQARPLPTRLFATEAEETASSTSQKAERAPAVTHQCLTGCLDWTENLVGVFADLQRQAEMARLRTERLDDLLFKTRDERDDCRQELDALKLVDAARRQENEQMRHVLHDLNIDLEAYMSSLAYQERLNKVLAEEADRQRGKAERLRTTAEQQEFCEMGAVELAMKAEDTLEIEIGLRQVLTYSSAELIAKKQAHLSRNLKKLDTFSQRMLSLLQLRPTFNTGTLESQRLNLLQGLGDLMERIANAKETLRQQEATLSRSRKSSETASLSFPVLAQRMPTSLK